MSVLPLSCLALIGLVADSHREPPWFRQDMQLAVGEHQGGHLRPCRCFAASDVPHVHHDLEKNEVGLGQVVLDHDCFRCRQDAWPGSEAGHLFQSRHSATSDVLVHPARAE